MSRSLVWGIALASILLASFLYVLNTDKLQAAPDVSLKAENANPLQVSDLQSVRSIKYELLAGLYKATLSLLQENKEHAEQHLNTAMRQLEQLPDAAANKDTPVLDPTAPDKPEQKVVRLAYGTALVKQSSIMPVPSEPLTLAMLKNTLDINGIKRGSIHTAAVGYAIVKIDKPTMRRKLLDALDKTSKGHFGIAQNIIHSIHETSLKDDAQRVALQVQARDHLVLARYLIKQAEFDGARSALKQADQFAQQASQQKMPWNNVNLATLRGKIADISKQLSKQDPTVIESIDKALDEWWNQLS